MGARVSVPFGNFIDRAPTWEEIAQDAVAESSKLRSELATAQARIRTLESDLEDEKRRRHIESGYRMIAQRDRDTSTGSYRPIETATTWRCGKCGSDILRNFCYCPTCCGHIDWKAAVFS